MAKYDFLDHSYNDPKKDFFKETQLSNEEI